MVNYYDYINSQEWIEKRNLHIKNDPLCRACGSTKRLTVHHLSYKNLWQEKAWDLKTLCWICHSELHKRFDLQNRVWLKWFTKIFIRKRRVELWTSKIQIKSKRKTVKVHWTEHLMRKVYTI